VIIYNSNLPLVSIVIPVYNAAAYLKEAIDSVLAQDYPKVELIVLNDGSTDSSTDVLKSYPAGSFIWMSHSNMGQSATLNKGWNMANGDILSYLSADDALLMEATSQSVELLQQVQSVVMTYCDYILMDNDSEDIRRVFAPDYDYERMVSDIVVQPGPGVFFRKEAFEKIGGWNIAYRQVPDLEYWLRLGLEGEFYHIPQPLAKFRVHNGSQSFTESSVQKAEECVHVIEAYFNQENIPVEIRRLEMRSKCSAHLFVARMHLRAGRYKEMLDHMRIIFHISPALLFSANTVRMLGNGLLFRLHRMYKDKP